MTPNYPRLLAELAASSGRGVADVVELWTERAAAREYEGNQSRADAERDALVDVKAEVMREVAGRPTEDS